MRGRIVRAFPLTPLQEGMLYHTLREPESGLYHGQCEAVLRGPLDEETFRRAWALAVERHEALRTVFAWERRERPLQVVLDSVAPDLRFLDWTHLASEVRQERWTAVVARDRRLAFDLAKAPPRRLTVVKESPDSHRLLWGVHHALLDGWSALSVLGEVLTDYDALVAGKDVARPPVPSYAQYVGWLEAKDGAEARSYWTRALAGVHRATPLPYRTRGAPSSERVTTRLEMSSRDTAALGAAASRARVTLNTMVVGAWARVLGRRTGSTDVVFGVTATERPASIPGVDAAAGLYLTTVPARVHLPADARVGEWLAGLQRDLSEGRAHGSPGLSEIQRMSAVAEGPLLNSLVVFEGFPDEVGRGLRGGLLEAVDIAIRGPSDLPLALLVFPGERLSLLLEHDPADLSPQAATVLLREVVQELEWLRGDPGRTIGEPRSEEDRMRFGPPAMAGDSLARDAADVLSLVETRARERPGATALAGPWGRVSYGEMDRLGDETARRILLAGGGPGSLVGVVAHRSAAGIVGMLGALKAGCAYVPVDPAQPKARLEAQAACADLLAIPEDLDDGLGTGKQRIVIPAVGSVPEDSPPLRRADAEPSREAAYAVFTSGSTGEPKAVVVERSQLAWSTAARFQFYDEHPGVFLLLSPLSVDSATAGIYWTLCSGGTLVLPAPRAEQDLGGLVRLMADEGVTHTLLVPSLYRAILEDADLSRLGSLRVVVVAGEACQPQVAQTHARLLPEVRLFNEYGPSEASVWTTAEELTADPQGPVTIGRPVPSARIHLLDDDLRVVPEGAAGEIWIGGPGVARGYLHSPELTSERFVADPGEPGSRLYRTGDLARLLADGRLEFLGRRDQQLKVRGHRVEAGEIEAALAAHTSVRAAVVGLVEPGLTDAPTPTPEELVSALLQLSAPDSEEILREVEAMGD